MYYFLRHGKLDLPYKDHSEMSFEVLADLASEKLNPPIDKKVTRSLISAIAVIVPFERLEKIYTSPSQRARETATLIADYTKERFQKESLISVLPELREVHFDLREIYALSPQGIDIQAVNQAVFRATLSGKGAEPINSLYNRVDSIFKTLANEERQEAALITHDFLMRAVELYAEHKGIPRETTYEDLLQTRRNSYLRGFAVQTVPWKFLPLEGGGAE